MVGQLSHVLYQGKQNTAVSKEHIHQVLSLKIRVFPFITSFKMQRNSALLTSKMTLKMCVKSKHLPLLHALKFPFLVHLYAAFLFDQVVQRTWAVPERHLLVHIFHHPENIANMFLITYLKNKAVTLYCTVEEHIHLKLSVHFVLFKQIASVYLHQSNQLELLKAFCSIPRIHQILTSMLISSRL